MSMYSPGSDPNYPPGPSGWTAPPPGHAPAYATPVAAQMGFGDAVRSVLTQYATFSGRARRAEYWWFVLASFFAALAARLIDVAIGVSLLQWVVTLGLLLPTLAVGVRRLHDTGRSGWWMLLALVPFGGIVVLVFACLDSQPGTNRFGPSPKYPSA